MRQKLIDCGGFGKLVPVHMYTIPNNANLGRVYIADVTSPSSLKMVAVKKQRITSYVRNSMTRHEAAALLLLKGT